MIVNSPSLTTVVMVISNNKHVPARRGSKADLKVRC
jgi:hypothetical protein